MDSILLTIKKLIGVQNEYTIFDPDILVHLNTSFAALNQMGVGPKEGFFVEDESVIWDNYITGVNMTMVKSYLQLSVRLLFDPPTSGILMEALKQSKAELEWRLLHEVEKDFVWPEPELEGGE